MDRRLLGVRGWEKALAGLVKPGRNGKWTGQKVDGIGWRTALGPGGKGWRGRGG